MKLLPLLLLLAVLASCGTQTPAENIEENETNEEITVPVDDEEYLDSISDELDGMDNNETSMNNEVIEFDSAYRNPAGDVDMIVKMEVNNGVIEAIEANATTWDVSDFSTALQSLIGSPVEEGETFYAAGSSIASEAFNNAIKAL